MTNKLEPTELPDNHVEFAKQVAAVARQHGISKFTMEYEPEFDRNASSVFWGKLRIFFSAVDGRGRPADNLAIVYETELRHTISSTPESSN